VVGPGIRRTKEDENYWLECWRSRIDRNGAESLNRPRPTQGCRVNRRRRRKKEERRRRRWSVWLFNLFPLYVDNGKIFGKLNGLKMCVLIFSTNFMWNIFHCKKNWTKYCHKRT
jgi:hypothetical protein